VGELLLKSTIKKVVIVGTRYEEDVERLAKELKSGSSKRGLKIDIETSSHLSELEMNTIGPNTMVLVGKHVRFKDDGLFGTRQLGDAERSMIAENLRQKTGALVTGFMHDRVTGRYFLGNI
jgi:hypothetical protein